jgi:hypothetical protein
MSTRRPSKRARLACGVGVLVAGLALAGCTEVESESATGYEPAKLELVKGRSDLQRVTFTAEGARRIGLRTARVRRSARHKLVPYAALLYDPEGKTYVYTSPRALEYLRAEVHVHRIDGDRVLLSDGPPAGTEVVTVGATEVYGTEREVASH